MPRIRFFSNDILETIHSTIATGNRLEYCSGTAMNVLSRAASLALGQETLAELLEDLAEERTFRVIADLRATSASTEWRRRRQHLHQLRHAIIAVQLFDGLESGSGATVDPATGRELRRSNGYLVSVRRLGSQFSRLPTVGEIFDWLKDRESLLSDYFPGSWPSQATRDFWLDLNRWFPTLDEALTVATTERQEAIFDLRHGCAILAAMTDSRRAA